MEDGLFVEVLDEHPVFVKERRGVRKNLDRESNLWYKSRQLWIGDEGDHDRTERDEGPHLI